MRGSDLTLLLASDKARGTSERHPLDRIRMQKALFLLVQRGSEDWRTAYSYRPYDWGPYSSGLSADIQALERHRLLQIEDVPGRRYGRYSTTEDGERRAGELWESLSDKERKFVKRVREYVTARSFSDLLREVYSAYPNFATASKFTG